MYWWIKFFIASITIVACAPTPTEQDKVPVTSETIPTSAYLVEASALMQAPINPHIKFIDVRKKEEYDTLHINGAIHLGRSAIEDTSFPYRGVMASPTQLSELFSSMGIQNEDTLIIYDDNGLVEATRLWWILQNYDFKQVKLLHGGFTEWQALGGAISTDVPLMTPSQFYLTETPSMKYYVSKEKVQSATRSNPLVLDTRSKDEFSGKRQKNGAAKAGRLPNSINIDWSESVNFHGSKRFKSIEELQAVYHAVLAREDTIIVYCHSGVRSAHTSFVLTQLLGMEQVKNYDGSWAEWSYFDELSYVQDSITTLIN
jgi:thiosulfate/3-mercaptopyruvate sulfurtransferase